MDLANSTQPYEDNRDANQSQQSLRSIKGDSQASSIRKQKHNKDVQEKIQGEDEKESCTESRSKTRILDADPDRDQVSDRESQRSSGSFYSDDYENESQSERTLTPYSRSRTPCASVRKGGRTKKASNSPFHKTGVVGRRGVSRPQRPGVQHQSQLQRRTVRSQSKDSTPSKDLDLVTKQMLSARLLKINELRNALAELQQRTDELKKENRILRQLQVRQEKALHRYDDTESEITQLLSRHNNETHVLRERLRRTQERERAAERRLKDCEEQLLRSQTTVARLKKLVEQRELGAREELSRKLEEEKTRNQEGERKIKELERNMELSNGSFQRQLVAERKKSQSAQEEIRTLQEELEQLSNKLKRKERELDTRNIYANGLAKLSPRKDTDSVTKHKVPSRNSSKAVQTEDGMFCPEFPTPPPAISDANEYSQQAPDDYLSLKELDRGNTVTERREEPNRERRRMRESEKERRREKELEKDESEERKRLNQQPNTLEEKTKRSVKKSSETPAKGSVKEREEEGTKTSSLRSQKEEENNRKRGQIQEEAEKWNHEALGSQRATEEARRKKEHLLAKMSEIDRQNQAAKDTSTIFGLTQPEESPSLPPGSREGGRERQSIEGGVNPPGIGRRGIRGQNSSDDLAFGNYAPSFGRSSSRGSSGVPPPPAKDDRALEAIGVFSVGVGGKETERETGKDRKSNLMQQLFGAVATSAGDDASSSNRTEILGSPPATNGIRPRRDGPLTFSSSSSSTPPATSLHVAETRPSIRAIASFDDDIEELAL
ncbi:lebercilin isoform X2 [Genypterus blacodes]|uniref:lebercilin isoform X2 n=1 Tax=Genypterus blacodes TaxID=154954 RepID=UPI003F770D41